MPYTIRDMGGRLRYCVFLADRFVAAFSTLEMAQVYAGV